MDTVELLRQFSDPEIIKSLSLSQRVLAGLCTTVLGMGITFVSLIILQVITSLFTKVCAFSFKKEQVEQTVASAPAAAPAPQPVAAETGVPKEVVAAITVALAMQLETKVSNIVIRNVKRVEDATPRWNKVGLVEEMQNFLN